MARLIVITALLTSLMLPACGGSGASTTSTTPPNEIVVHWSRCPGSHYGAAVAGISCRNAYRHIPITGPDATGSAGHIRASGPHTFTKQGFDCTQFPLENGSGVHVVCDQDNQHFAFYFTP